MTGWREDPPAPSRCRWVPAGDDLYARYHDEEWGTPLRDGRALFALLCLEGQQAGLSWRTILYRRDGYRAVFLDFDPQRLARLTEDDVARLATDSRIIRHRGKVASIVTNARALLELEASGTPFAEYVWSFSGGDVIVGDGSMPHPRARDGAREMSRDLRRRGFTFVGPTICYAFMQSAGLVMDHELACFRREALLP